MHTFLLVIFLLRDMCVCPIKSRRFLFRRYVNIGFSVKDDAILLLVCRRCQFLFSVFLMLGGFSLNVVLNLMRLLSVLSFSASSSFLLTDVALIS